MTRVLALLSKEIIDLRQNPGVFLTAALTGVFSMIIPFFVAIIVPAVTGERLSDSSDFDIAVEMYRTQPGARDLDPEGAIQAWIFQTFLIFMMITPVAGAMSIAAYSVVGEKQARTLEPILATPISTLELLGAKVLGALLPALALAVGTFVVYVAGIAVAAHPGVYLTLLRPRSLALVFVLAPLASLAALQLAVCVSSRVNDARSAQQIGSLVILPIVGLMVAQLMGALQLTPAVTMAVSLALVVLNAGLLWLAAALFARESILTRWR
jgi:ABC-2 type transport system permease protein